MSPTAAMAGVDASAITLAKLPAGPASGKAGTTTQAEYREHAERGRRLDVFQHAEHEFDPVPFDAEAARHTARWLRPGHLPPGARGRVRP